MKTHEFSIEIHAGPGRLWEILTDLAKYPEWNSVIPAAKGTLTPGSRLDLRLKLSEGNPTPFAPEVVKVIPEKELLLTKSLAHKRLLYAKHYFLIAELDANTVRFSQRWEFSGLLLPLLWGKLEAGLGAFARLNKDIKREAER
jgi:hypothetical protein